MSERTRSILRRGVPGDVSTWPARSQELFQRTKIACKLSPKMGLSEQFSRAHRARPARPTTGFKGGIRAYSHTARRLCHLFLRALFFLLAPTPKPGSTQNLADSDCGSWKLRARAQRTTREFLRSATRDLARALIPRSRGCWRSVHGPRPSPLRPGCCLRQGAP